MEKVITIIVWGVLLISRGKHNQISFCEYFSFTINRCDEKVAILRELIAFHVGNIET